MISLSLQSNHLEASCAICDSQFVQQFIKLLCNFAQHNCTDLKIAPNIHIFQILILIQISGTRLAIYHWQIFFQIPSPEMKRLLGKMIMTATCHCVKTITMLRREMTATDTVQLQEAPSAQGRRMQVPSKITTQLMAAMT